MNPSDLARMMLKWEQMQRAADEYAVAIKDAVLEIGASQTVGNVKATYYKGRKTYDWKWAGKQCPQKIIDGHTRTETTTDWKAVCLDADLENVPFTQAEPSVTLRLVT